MRALRNEKELYVKPDVLHKKAAIKALWVFRKKRTWREENYAGRFEAMQELVVGLADAYGVPVPDLQQGRINGSNSGSSFAMPPNTPINHTDNWVIVMNGRLSIITLLHEFAHVIGKDQMEAQIFAVNLFRKVYPSQFEKLVFVGGMAMKRNEVPDFILEDHGAPGDNNCMN